MLHLDLEFFTRRKVPMIFQSEAAECGLACLAMIASFYGHRIDLLTLRQRYSMSAKGATLAHLISLAERLQLISRPLRLELSHLAQLSLPALVHLDFKHFAVLTQVRKDYVVLNDPARGIRNLPMAEFSKTFTGVVLEIQPSSDFRKGADVQTLKLHRLVGKLHGLRGALTQLFALVIAMQVFVLAAPFFIQLVVDSALVSEDRDLLFVLAIGFLLLAICQVGVTALRSWVLTFLGTALNVQLTTNLFRHLVHLPIEYFHKRRIGDVISRFQSLDVIQRTLTANSIEILIDGAMASLIFGAMLLYSVPLATISVLAAIAYLTLRLAQFRLIREANEEQIICSAKQNTYFLETIRGVQTIKLFNREAQRRGVWQNLFVDSTNAGIRVQRLTITYQALNGLLFATENILVVWLGALLVLSGGFSIGMLLAYLAFKTQFINRVTSVTDKTIEFRMLSLHTERIADMALTPRELTGNVERSDTNLAEMISLSRVNFRYSENDPFVLHDISMSIKRGELVAIVGPSGCGKSTLLKILVGLYQPTQGAMSFQGRELQDYGLHAYRAMLGSVMQDDLLFAGTIADNICFFDPQPDAEQIQRVAITAAIHNDIRAMPMGYNTLIGDMGMVLSGGQKQRVLLARALYGSPKILFLDEATSHLDVESERLVNSAVRDMNITKIIVAHRAETIATANRIVRMESGRIVEDVEAPSVATVRAGSEVAERIGAPHRELCTK